MTRPAAVVRLAGSVFLAGWLLAVACAPALPAAPGGDGTPDTGDASAPATREATAAGEPLAPALVGELTANCQPDRDSRNGMGQGLKTGEKAIDFVLEDIDGAEVRLSGLLAERPVVMIFGSFT